MVPSNEINQGSENANTKAAELSSVSGFELTDVEREIEAIIAWYSGSFGADEFVQYKETFFLTFGKVFPEDDFFNRRMSYFIDQFVFEHHLPLTLPTIVYKTPFERYLELNVASHLATAQHSVFYVQKVQTQSMLLKDLITTERIRVDQAHNTSFEGIQKKDIFQGFIYDLHHKKALSRGLIFHPNNVHHLIRKDLRTSLKKNQFDKHQTLARLASQQLRHLRHLHVNPKIFYNPKTPSAKK